MLFGEAGGGGLFWESFSCGGTDWDTGVTNAMAQSVIVPLLLQ